MDLYCLAVAAADEWIEGWLVAAGVAMREYSAAFERLARRRRRMCDMGIKCVFILL